MAGNALNNNWQARLRGGGGGRWSNPPGSVWTRGLEPSWGFGVCQPSSPLPPGGWLVGLLPPPSILHWVFGPQAQCLRASPFPTEEQPLPLPLSCPRDWARSRRAGGQEVGTAGHLPPNCCVRRRLLQPQCPALASGFRLTFPTVTAAPPSLLAAGTTVFADRPPCQAREPGQGPPDDRKRAHRRPGHRLHGLCYPSLPCPERLAIVIGHWPSFQTMAPPSRRKVPSIPPKQAVFRANAWDI